MSNRNGQISSIPLSELEAEIKARQSQLAEAEAERASLQSQLEAVNARIISLTGGEVVVHKSVANKLAAATPSRTGSERSRLAHQTSMQNGKSLVEFAYGILKQVRKPLKAMDLAERIMSKGYKTTSTLNVFRASVSSAMARDQRFVNTGQGLYTLKELQSAAKPITISLKE